MTNGDPYEELRKLRNSLDDVWDVLGHTIRPHEFEQFMKQLELAVATLETLEERFDYKPEVSDED